MCGTFLRKLAILIFIGIQLIAQVSCRRTGAETSFDKPLDSLKLEYATGFSLYYYEDYKELTVRDPWKKNRLISKYYLVESDDVLVPNDGQKIIIPIKTIAATSVTHFEFLRLIGQLSTIKGVCSPNLIYNSEIRNGVKDNKIADLGDAFQINFEKTVAIHPSIVMISGYNQHDPFSERLMQAGIPVVTNIEWMESSLLARAEWIKFVAAFYDKELIAAKIFSQINNRYNQVKSLAGQSKNKPRIMAGNSFRGTWYVPAGRNFMSGLFEDAGGIYFYANDTTVGSLPLQIETVIKNFSDADVWLNCNFNSLKELNNSDVKHRFFKAYKSSNVYSFNNRLLKSTANDFWESAIARPDLLLSDVIKILHPQLLPDYQFTYAKKLEN